MKPVHQLQIHPIVHNYKVPLTIPPKLHLGPRSSVGKTDTQTAVTNIHFASAMPHTKRNKQVTDVSNVADKLQMRVLPSYSLRLVGWGLTALLTQNRSYRACRFVGIFYSKL